MVDATVPRRRFAAVVRNLAASNAAIYLFALVTAPLQAHALGPEGRGLLAAVLVPTAVAPWIADMGRASYATHASARGVAPGRLIGSLGALAVATGILGMVAAPALASLFADGRDVVYQYLLIGLLLLPVLLFGQVLTGINTGLERWGAVIASRFISAGGLLVAVVVLFAFGRLTVATTALSVFACSLLSLLPQWLPLRRERPRFSPRAAIAGARFGARAWVASLASLSNISLDQLLMAVLVSERQLGLYAVAFTLSNVSAAFTGAVVTSVAPRVARGDQVLAQVSVRLTLAFVTGIGAVVAAAAPIGLPLLFGSAFADAVPLAWILLAAAVPLAGAQVLGSALIADGAPGLPAITESLALVVTFTALWITLPRYGALAAAVVSVCAYSLNFALLVVLARRRIGGRAVDFVLARPAELRQAAARVREMVTPSAG